MSPYNADNETKMSGIAGPVIINIGNKTKIKLNDLLVFFVKKSIGVIIEQLITIVIKIFNFFVLF